MAANSAGQHGCKRESAALAALPQRTRHSAASRVWCAGLAPALDPAPGRQFSCPISWRARSPRLLAACDTGGDRRQAAGARQCQQVGQPLRVIGAAMQPDRQPGARREALRQPATIVGAVVRRGEPERQAVRYGAAAAGDGGGGLEVAALQASDLAPFSGGVPTRPTGPACGSTLAEAPAERRSSRRCCLRRRGVLQSQLSGNSAQSLQPETAREGQRGRRRRGASAPVHHATMPTSVAASG
jgi:hypothetical protein